MEQVVTLSKLYSLNHNWELSKFSKYTINEIIYKYKMYIVKMIKTIKIINTYTEE